MHQARIERHGNPHVKNGAGATGWTKDEFLERYIPNRPENGCWYWNQYINNQGYGSITQTKANGKQAPVKGHRYVYEMFVGPIPEGQLLRHTCDNPPCVNPGHLIPGTHADNAQDMVVRGRSLRGKKNPQAVLTETEVHEILRLVNEGAVKQEVARKFGVKPSTISSILHGRNWNHVTGLPQSRKQAA